jgi:hypothetical protein
LVLLQCRLLALYRIVLPVFILSKELAAPPGPHLIHCGIGRFCFPFLARIRLTRVVLRADMAGSVIIAMAVNERQARG